MTNKKIDSRASQTKVKEQKKVWTPPSSLDAPPAPDGFKHRWIRAETLGTEDRQNMAGRLREGRRGSAARRPGRALGRVGSRDGRLVLRGLLGRARHRPVRRDDARGGAAAAASARPEARLPTIAAGREITQMSYTAHLSRASRHAISSRRTQATFAQRLTSKASSKHPPVRRHRLPCAPWR